MKELMNKVWKKEEGFSLIELIIVIAILAIIAAIAVPNLLSNIQKANVSTDETNGKLIADSISTFIAQNPTNEGTTYGTAAVPATFTTGTGNVVIEGAVSTILNGTTPLVKNNDNGNDGTTFCVYLDANGVVKVYEDAAAANIVFPN